MTQAQADARGSTTREGFSVLLVAIKREPWIFALSTVGSLLFGALTVADAWVLGWSTDNVVLPAFRDGEIEDGLLVTILALFLGVAILRAVGIVARRLGAGVMQYRMQAHYRRAVTRQYLSLPMEWHQRHPTGQLLSNANSDVEAAWGPIAPLPMAVGTVAMMVIAIAQMFAADVVMALIGLLVFPAVIVVNLVYQHFTQALMTRAQQLRAEVSEIAHESFDGALVVKTLGREGEETARFAARAHELRDVNIKAGRVRAAFDPTLAALPGLGVLVVLSVGVSRVLNGHTDAGDVVTIAYLLTIVSFPIRSLGWLLGEFPRSVVGFRRVSSVLAATGEMQFGQRSAVLDGAGARLELEQVAYAYDQSQPVLDGVTFSVAPGRTVAVVGATASGKSTLTTLLTRLVDPDGGRILLDGVALPDLDRGELATSVSIVPQTAFLFDDTVRGNVDPRSRHLRRRRLGGPARGAGRRLRGRSRRGARHPAGGARHVAVRRAAPAHLAGPRARPPTPAADPRRRHLGRRPGGRGPDPRCAARPRGWHRSDAARRGLPQGDHRSGRRGGPPRGRPGRRHRQPCRAARPQPCLRQPGQRLRAGVRGGDRMSTNVSGTRMDTGEDIKAFETIRRGVHYSPELKEGIGFTLVLAVLASLGQVVVPIAVQQTLDRGLRGPGGPDVGFTVLMGMFAAVGIIGTGVASYAMTNRLFTTSESGLATLRIKAFRHVHDLPLLTQNTERRGALVARVTSDVDQVSQFLVFGGLIFVVSIGQMFVATIVMVIYSWQLALVVWLCFAPLFLSLRFFQRRLSDAYGMVRRQVGILLSAISEPVVGAAVVRSYAIEGRTQERIDLAIERHRSASTRAQGFTAFSFSLGGISAGLANAGVLIVGVWLGFAGDITAGEVLAFAFLVTLFVGPVQMGTQILTDAQNAIAGWRRVIGILDTPADLVDPGPDGEVLPRGPIDVTFDDVTFAYPGGPPVLREITMDIAAGTRVAIVGETGSGKSTFAKLLTRLMDPSEGTVLLDGIDVRQIAPASLRRSVVLVPQEGFLFDDTLAANVRYGKLDATEDEILASADELGLGDWVAGLPRGPRDPGRPARRLAVRRRATAGRAAAGPPRRSRPAGPRRGDERRRPGPRDADRPGARAADEWPDVRDHRPPPLHRRERRRGGRRRRGPDRPARPARRPRHPTRHLRRPPLLLDRSADLTPRGGAPNPRSGSCGCSRWELWSARSPELPLRCATTPTSWGITATSWGSGILGA